MTTLSIEARAAQPVALSPEQRETLRAWLLGQQYRTEHPSTHAAPGGWAQVAVKRGAISVVGVDLLPVEPVPGAVMIQADFTHPGVDQQMMDLLGGAPDLVLSDMAHNTVGHRQTDHLKIIALIEIAADFAIRTLKPGGHFVSKNFQGGDAGGVLARLRAEFETVKYVKPESSRKDSAEVFLVAMNRR